MAKTLVRELDLPVIDLDGLTEAETASGAGNFALTGALIQANAGRYVAGLSLASNQLFPGGVKLIIDTTGDSSGVLFTLTGTDPDGRPLVETKTSISSGATYTTVGYFRTLDSFHADGATADDVTLGTVDEAMSASVHLDYGYRSGPPLITAVVTGTVAFDVQESYNNIADAYLTASAVQSAQGFADIVLDKDSATIDFANITATDAATIRSGATALAVQVNTYTDAAEVRLSVTQSSRGA